MHRQLRFALAAATVVVAGARPSFAQSVGDGFLFHSPDVTFAVRGGYSLATAQSDVFDDVTSNLTLDRRDFSSLTLGGDFAIHVSPRTDLVFAGAYSRAHHKSEFRNLIDNNDQPIEQTTTFERVPLTANVRINLAPPGRAIGKLAWIPNRVVPYVGAGVGAMRYRFKQDGDFVNFATNAVFPAVLDSEGWTFVGQGMAGVDYNLSSLLGLSFDARYLYARGDLGTAFKGFERIDLSGLTATVGLSLRL